MMDWRCLCTWCVMAGCTGAIKSRGGVMSDNKNTDMRLLGIILQLIDEGYCKVKGCANNTDVGQLSIMQTWDDEAIYSNGTEGYDSTINLIRLGMVQGRVTRRGLAEEAFTTINL